jgi:hypothetical protein
MELNEDMRTCSFDIVNMYTSIPKSDAINIINSILNTNAEIVETNHKEIIQILKKRRNKTTSSLTNNTTHKLRD